MSSLSDIFIILSNFVGGVEMGAFITIIFMASFAFLNRASMPTIFFIVFLLVGSLADPRTETGGIFLLLYGLCVIAGSVFIFMALRKRAIAGS